MIELVKGGDIVELRNSQWGDSRSIDLNKIVRHTRSGELRHTHPSGWGTIKVYSYVFTTLKEDIRDSMKTFLSAHAGEEVILRRIETGPITLWTMDGYIITPIIEIITVREPCFYDIAFEFQQVIP